MTTKERAAVVAHAVAELVEGLVSQQAMPDDSWRPELVRIQDAIVALAAPPSGGAEGETTHEERTDMPKSISCREFGLCAKDPSRGLGNFCEQCPSQPTPQPPGTKPSGGAEGPTRECHHCNEQPPSTPCWWCGQPGTAEPTP